MFVQCTRKGKEVNPRPFLRIKIAPLRENKRPAKFLTFLSLRHKYHI